MSKITCLTQIGVKLCPDSGKGVHKWIYYAACSCSRAGIAAHWAIALIEQAMTRDPQPSNEVEQAVNAAYSIQSETKASKRFPDCDMDMVRAVVKNGISLEELKKRSPTPNPKQNEVLASLFKPQELLCAGSAVHNPQIYVLPEDKGLWSWGGAQFIVPSPMSTTRGLTKDGKLSARSLSNTGPRRWLVIECDFKTSDAKNLGAGSTFDLCATVLWKLSEHRPIILVVSSGSRSLHGWFPVLANEPESPKTSDLWRFMALACKLGGDSATWKKCQWVRMPGGFRRSDNGKIMIGADGRPTIQEIVYFNPDAARRYLP